MDIAGLVIGALGLIVAGLSLWRAWGTRAQAREARADADAAQSAADRSAAASERAAVALEQSLDIARTQAARYMPPWRIVHVRRSLYALVNDGDEPALQVRIDAGDIFVGDGEKEHDRIEAGSDVNLMLARSMGTRSSSLTVTWNRPGSTEQRTWTGTVPWAG